MTFTNSKIDLFEINNDRHGVILKNNRLANKLNVYLNYYPQDYKFRSTDEPVFKFDNKHLDMVISILKLKKLLKVK